MYRHTPTIVRATYRAPEYNLPTFLFTDQPKKYKIGRGRWVPASCQVSLNSVQRFQRRNRKYLSQSEPRAAILFFRSARKHKLGRGHWDLASLKFRWILFSGFRGEEENVSANQRPGRPSCFSDRPLPRKCDKRSDRRRTKWSLCAAMLRRRHKKPLKRVWPICKANSKT